MRVRASAAELATRTPTVGGSGVLVLRTDAEDRPLRALVVEDTPAIATILTRALEFRGMNSVLARNGEQALERLAVESFDFVLMDVRMPILDGIETTRAIRTREITTGAHLPIIAVTADLVVGMRERCLLAGSFVDKPFRTDSLFEEIWRVMGSPSSASLRGPQSQA